MIEKININGVEYAVTPVTEGEAANGVTVKVDGVTYLLGEPIVSPVVAPAASSGSQAIEKVQVNGVVYDIADVEGVEAEIQRAIEAEESLRTETNTNAANLAETKKDIANQLFAASTADKVTLTGRNQQSMRINFSAEIPAATTEKAGVMSAEDKKKVNASIKNIDVNPNEDDVELDLEDNTEKTSHVVFPAATSESAGVMSAEDKREQVKMTPLVNGDVIVGQSREVYSRTGKSDNATFLKRTTAGSTSIGGGIATLKQVGGNIVKNLVDKDKVAAWDSVNIEKIGDIHKVTTKGAGLDGTKAFVYWACKMGVIGHKYYAKIYFCSNTTKHCFFLYKYTAQNAISFKQSNTNTWQISSGVVEYAVEGVERAMFFPFDCTETVGGELAYVTAPIVIDLTEMFGAGNEPTKEECDKLFGTMDALPQGLTVAKPNTFTSTGFNQFNPENVLEGKAIVDNAIVSGDKKIAVIPCLPCKVGVGENNGYCIHGDFGEDIKVYLTPLNPMEVEEELYMHELTKDATTDTYVPLIKGYMLVEVPTTANLCAHFLWSEDKCERDSYEPYFESKIELPDIPEMSEWGLAGLFSAVGAKAVYDTIDLENSKYTRRVGFCKIKELSWETGVVTANGVSYRYFYTPNKFMQLNSKCLLEGYVKVKQEALSVKELPVLSFMAYDTGRIYLRNAASTVNEFLALDGEKRVFYELITPEVYPIIVGEKNYISSDYGTEEFDAEIPLNANSLYYQRSLVGETRNFLDRLMAGLGTNDVTAIADRILAVVNPVVEPTNTEEV